MTIILGPDGNSSAESLPDKEFKAGGMALKTKFTPDMILEKAKGGARQLAMSHAYESELKRSGSYKAAQDAANIAASSITDPFIMEPCAMAVFMFLSREVEYRDMVIAQLNERLVSLGAEPIDIPNGHRILLDMEKSLKQQ